MTIAHARDWAERNKRFYLIDFCDELEKPEDIKDIKFEPSIPKPSTITCEMCQASGWTDFERCQHIRIFGRNIEEIKQALFSDKKFSQAEMDEAVKQAVSKTNMASADMNMLDSLEVNKKVREAIRKAVTDVVEPLQQGLSTHPINATLDRAKKYL